MRDPVSLSRLQDDIVRFSNKVENLIEQNKQHELKMTMAVSQLKKQDKRLNLKLELEMLARNSTEGPFEESLELYTSKEETLVPKEDTSSSSSPIQKRNKKSLSMLPLNTTQGDASKDQLLNSLTPRLPEIKPEKPNAEIYSPNHRVIRKVDIVDDYEEYQNKKFKPFFRNRSQEILQKLKALKEADKIASLNTEHQSSPKKKVEFDRLSIFIPNKNSFFEHQKKVNKIRFNSELLKHGNTDLSPYRRMESLTNRSEQEPGHMLCKTLKLEKKLLEFKEQKSSLMESLEKMNTDRQSTMNYPEFSTEFSEEYATPRVMLLNNKSPRNVRLPTLTKDSNFKNAIMKIHVVQRSNSPITKKLEVALGIAGSKIRMP